MSPGSGRHDQAHRTSSRNGTSLSVKRHIAQRPSDESGPPSMPTSSYLPRPVAMISPNVENNHLARSQSEYSKHSYKAALKHIRTALRQDSQNVDCLVHAAYCFMACSLPEKANAALRNAQEILDRQPSSDDRARQQGLIDKADLRVRPFEHLPAEIIAEILQHAYNEMDALKSPFLALVVCSKWRRIALSMPTLWRDTTVVAKNWSAYHRSDALPPFAETFDVYDAVEYFVKAAGAALETLTLPPWHALGAECLASLLEAAARNRLNLRSIDVPVVLPEYSYWNPRIDRLRATYQRLIYLLCYAPRLQSVRLHIMLPFGSDNTEDKQALREGLFSSIELDFSPSNTRLIIPSELMCALLEGRRQLTIVHPRGGMGSWHEPGSATFVDLLTQKIVCSLRKFRLVGFDTSESAGFRRLHSLSSDHLTELTLGNFNPYDMPAAVDIPTDWKWSLPSLRALWIYCLDLLTHFDCPRLRDLTIVPLHHMAVSRASSGTEGRTTWPLPMSVERLCLTVDRDELPFGMTQQICIEILADVLELLVPAHVARGSVSMGSVQLPNLTHLSIQCASQPEPQLVDAVYVWSKENLHARRWKALPSYFSGTSPPVSIPLSPILELDQQRRRLSQGLSPREARRPVSGAFKRSTSKGNGSALTESTLQQWPRCKALESISLLGVCVPPEFWATLVSRPRSVGATMICEPNPESYRAEGISRQRGFEDMQTKRPRTGESTQPAAGRTVYPW